MQCDGDHRESPPSSPLAAALKATGDTGSPLSQHHQRQEPPPPPTTTAKARRESSTGVTEKRTVCDHCRRRRIRCDGQLPCQQCKNATLTCKRDHVPKKRGPKRGHGRVINELRATELALKDTNNNNNSHHHYQQQQQQHHHHHHHHRHHNNIYNSDGDGDGDGEGDGDIYLTSMTATATSPTSPRPPPFIPWMSAPSVAAATAEPTSPFTTNTFRPNSRSYFHLIPQCVELYYRHVYPIMPLVYMPAIRAAVARPATMEPTEKNLIYALCALTALHMSGGSLSAAAAMAGMMTGAGAGARAASGPPPVGPPPSWEAVGRFFLDECVALRKGYDFLEDVSLGAAVSSFWLSTSFFEISQSRKSWYYLREAMNLALDLGLHDDAAYKGLPPEDALCRRRVFWILFVTERSFAILRNKPLTLRRTPRLPARGHAYEDPEIHAGFVKLVRSYMPLDESFVNAWNDGSDPRVSAATYLNLQEVLAQPLDFLGGRTGPSQRRRSAAAVAAMGARDDDGASAGAGGEQGGDEEVAEETEPTAIQKADLLMTQQWLRLIVWQSSLGQGLLSTRSPNESMKFSYPLSIARDTVAALQLLPSHAIEVHGMGIFEKIFEIGKWCVNVLGVYDSGPGSPCPNPYHQQQQQQQRRPSSSSSFFGGGGGGDGAVAGMDYARGADLSLLTQGGRGGFHTDPLEFLVKMLSASPNSRTMFAEKLLMFASESPGSLRTALSPAPSTGTTSSTRTEAEAMGGGGGGGAVLGDLSGGENAAQDENATFALKTEFAAEGPGGMEGIKEVPGWGQTDNLSINTDLDLGVMGGGTAPPASDFSDLAGPGGEDYGFGTAAATTMPPNDFVGRGGPWSAPVVGGAFFGGMGLAHTGLGDNEMANVPRSQSESFPSGMMGVCDNSRRWV